jgi:hypothetical protein
MKKIVKRSRKFIRALLSGMRSKRKSEYAEWRDDQFSAPPLTSRLHHGTGRNLILGAATGYELIALLPFIRSLRRFSDCRAMLVVDNETVARQLSEFGIDTVVAVPAAGYTPHVNFSRNAVIHHTLAGLEGLIDWVFLLDTRDVVFQSDPFAVLPEADIAFFQEKEGYTFGVAPRNRSWLINTIGEKWLPVLERHDVLCGGTILAKRAAALSLCKLKLLVGGMIPDGRHAKAGVDQITTNIVARLGLIPHSTVIPYDQQVATVSKANLDFLIPAADDLFLNRTGKLPAVIHQYDRVPEIKAAINQRYAPSVLT